MTDRTDEREAFLAKQAERFNKPPKGDVSWEHIPPKTANNSAVRSPNHYLKLGYECIEIIASSLTDEAFRGYCMGNFLKYRFRMGDKDNMEQDFDKSKEYLDIYERWKHLCRE